MIERDRDGNIVMKGHFKKDGIRMILVFTKHSINQYIEQTKELEKNGWIQISPTDEV